MPVIYEIKDLFRLTVEWIFIFFVFTSPY